MNSFTKNRFFLLSVSLLLWVGSTASIGFAQTSNPKPLFQSITVQTNTSTPSPTPSATPLVKKTASSLPISSINAAYPVLADVDIPGYTGILVETQDGKAVMESYSNTAFNPASNVKVATAYAVLKTFGPNFRFRTDV